MSKVKSIAEIAEIVRLSKIDGLTSVNVHGCFDMLHYGHLQFFEKAKDFGDFLIVSITPDIFISKGPGRPYFNENQRVEFAAALEIVDFVVLNDSPDAITFLEKVAPDITARGIEYANFSDDITGKIQLEKNSIESVGGEMIFISGEVFSSTEIINSFGGRLSNIQNTFKNSIKNEVDLDTIDKLIDELSQTKVLTIGDVIIDEYTYCNPLGTVSKHSAIAGRFTGTELMAGGICAIAKNINTIVKSNKLITEIGELNSHIIDKIDEPELDLQKQNTCSGTYTTHKQRFIGTGYPNSISEILSEGKAIDTSNRLFELAYLSANNQNVQKGESTVERLVDEILDYDIVVVADFGHGVITPEVIDVLQNKAKFLCVNVQTNSSNFGFNLITKFKKANFICIDELEARLAVSDRSSPLEEIFSKLSKIINCQRIMITRGSRGISYLCNGEIIDAPALAFDVIDPIGAGDAVLAYASLAAQQTNPYLTLLSGSIAGMMATQIRGNSESISKIDFLKNIRGFLA